MNPPLAAFFVARVDNAAAGIDNTIAIAKDDWTADGSPR